MSRYKLFNISVEEEPSVIDTGEVNTIEADIQVEIQQDTNELNEAMESLEEAYEVHDDLTEQTEVNDDLLEKDVQISHKDVAASQESFIYALGRLKISKEDVMSYSYGLEYASTPREQLVISNEGIKEFAKKVWEAIKKAVMKVVDFIGNLIKKIKNFFKLLFNKNERLLRDIEKDISELKDPAFKTMNLRKYEEYLITAAENGKLNINEHPEWSREEILDNIKKESRRLFVITIPDFAYRYVGMKKFYDTSRGVNFLFTAEELLRVSNNMSNIEKVLTEVHKSSQDVINYTESNTYYYIFNKLVAHDDRESYDVYFTRVDRDLNSSKLDAEIISLNKLENKNQKLIDSLNMNKLKELAKELSNIDKHLDNHQKVIMDLGKRVEQEEKEHNKDGNALRITYCKLLSKIATGTSSAIANYYVPILTAFNHVVNSVRNFIAAVLRVIRSLKNGIKVEEGTMKRL